MGAWWETVLRLVLAVVLGGLLGWEREVQRKPAGLRTLMLVSLASAIFVLGARQAAFFAGEPLDAVRAMAGVAQGVGFLGAGLILRTRGEVRWLTTATSLWVAAAVGFATAEGLYVLALSGTLLAFAILRWMVAVEDRLVRKSDDKKPQG